MDVRTFIAGFIDNHEGGLSLDAKDAGNWFDAGRWARGERMTRGAGALVGSKFGITGGALATYLKTPAAVTATRIAAITRIETIDIGVELYYRRPGLAKLPWNRVTAAVLDMGFNAGSGTANKLLQRAIGAVDDGKIGPVTVAVFRDQVDRFGEEKVMAAFTLQRERYYSEIASNEGPNDPDKRFLKGWLNRARSFLKGTAWWGKWK